MPACGSATTSTRRGGTHTGRADAPQRVLGRRAEVVKDLVQLVDVAVRAGITISCAPKTRNTGADVLSALEDRLAGKQFSEDAPDGPDVDRRALDAMCAERAAHVTRGQGTHVVGEAEHDLGRAVPPRRDVFGHEALVGRGVRGRGAARAPPAREAEVADLELAVRVHEQVARLEVAVQHVRGVDVLEAAEGLVQEGLEVGVGEGLARADLRVGRGGSVGRWARDRGAHSQSHADRPP